MINITIILIGIIVLFAVLILLRKFFSVRICALCGAVSVSWIILLISFYWGYRVDPIIVGILMGGSIVGIMYFLEQKIPEKYKIFKLPFFLTLFSVVYFILERKLTKYTMFVVFLTWLFIFVLYVSRNTKKFELIGKNIINCCKNW